VEQGRDDLDDFLDEELRDPEFRGAYEDAMARSALLRTLVNRRHECQISQTEVANLMDTTQSAVSDLERGATDPRLSTLQRFARAVGCRLHLDLHANHPYQRSWLVTEPTQVTWSASASSAYWDSPLTHVVTTGEVRRSSLTARMQTSVAPVELRATSDEVTKVVST
jgi:transcriptional regulator with XRE-family HTH domain